MSHKNIVRAWKDAEYRSTLSDTERAQLPANPAGDLEIMAEFGPEMLVAGASSFWCTCLSECQSINVPCDMTGRIECSISFICMLPDTTPIRPFSTLES